MAIVKTVNFYYFRQAFYAHERQDQFSSAALREIFDWLESVSEDSGENMELDVIAICCDFAEFTIDEFIREYGVDVSDCNDEKQHGEAVENYLQNNGGWYSWVDDETIVFSVF